MIAMVRAYSYAIWLAIPLVAVGALRLFAALRLGTLVGRVFVALMLTPTVTSAVALAAVQAMTRQPFEAENSRVAAGCLRIESYTRLAHLPPGLVATDIDYGPFVLALTPHSVMSAPYHRLVAPIIAAHQIFALPPAAAREVAAQVKPTYLATCGRHTLAGIELHQYLLTGDLVRISFKQHLTLVELGNSVKLQPPEQEVKAGAESGSFGVTAPAGCTWSAATVQTWIHTTSTGSGNGTVSYTVDANSLTTSRSGTITVNGQVINFVNTGSTAGTTAIGVTPINIDISDTVGTLLGKIDAIISIGQYDRPCIIAMAEMFNTLSHGVFCGNRRSILLPVLCTMETRHKGYHTILATRM